MALASVTQKQQDDYLLGIAPAAKVAANKTGIPYELIASFWSWETHWGTNQTAKSNNHGGIKANSSGRDYVAGQYAGYNSVTSFANDWARLMTTDPGWKGYQEVLKVARSGADWTTIINKFNDSKYAEADYNVETIRARAHRLRGLSGSGASGKLPTAGVEVTPENQQQLATLGAGLVALVSAILVFKD